MNVDIPSVTFSGGTKYWIAIYADGTADPPYAGWGAHLSPILLSEGKWRWPEYGYPDWINAGDLTGYGPTDFCFQLTVKPDHDVGAISIDSPTDLQELCGCLPVAVTVENFGLEDESDVPVIVEIRSPLEENSFEEPLGVVWDITGVDCGWSITPVDTGNPSVVTPHTGDMMAELNSGNGGAGGSCLLYEIEPENLEDYCAPWMSFYMWHDTYGSDDYLEVWVNPGTGWQFIAGPYTRLCCPGCPVGWQQHTVSLEAFAGLPFVQIGFVGYCDGNPSAYNLHIDTFEKYDQEFYGETTVDIPVGETVEVEFDEEWCPCLYGEIFNEFRDFDVIACTALDIDEVALNDCITEEVTIYFPYEIDIAAISIDEPEEPIAGANPMKGTIKNVGQTEQCCFKARMGVYDLIIEDYFEEDFDTWENNPEGDYFSDDRPVGWRDIGSRYSDYGWEPDYDDDAGGDAPQAYLWWLWANYYSDNILQSPVFDTSGYVGLELEFKSYIDWYYGSSYCNMYVEATADGSSWTDITPWDNPISGNVGPDTYIIDIGDFVGSNTQIRFRFYGYYYYFDYWFIDDFKIRGKTIGDTAEYEEEVCVDCMEVCEELQLEFPDWTPAMPWPDCGEKNYVIKLWVNPCDPVDDNPANNAVMKEVSVNFWRDIELVFSSPAPGAKGDLLYDNGDPDGRNGIAGSMYAGYDNRLIDDFTPVGDDYTITDGHFTFVWNSGYDETNVDSVKVFFYLDEGGCSPSLTEYAEPAVTSFSGGLTGNYYFSRPEVYVDVEFAPVVVDEGQTCFVGFQVAGVTDDIAYWLTAESKDCEGFADLPYWGIPRWSPSSSVWGEAYDFNFKITGTLGSTPGPPIPDVYVPCGEQELCVTLNNLGDQPETVDVFMELYEFVTDPLTPTLAMTGTADNVAVAVGASEEVCFGTYDFAEAGVYWMLAEAIVEGILEDCDPTNNDGDIGIGVDCCPPNSMHYPDPLYPNGDNNWYTRSVDVEITAEDPLCPDPCWGTSSGVKEIHYIINGGSEVVVPNDNTDFKLTEDGVHLVEYWAVDNAGNEEDPFTFEIAIDKTAPTVDMFYTVYQDDAGAWHVDFEIAATDATSGNAAVKCYIGSTLDKEYTGPPYDTWTVDWIDDYSSVDFKAEAFDNAGNSDDVVIPGEQIDDEIHARNHATAHTVLTARTHSVFFNQQPRSR
jgi:hypothetical protein